MISIFCVGTGFVEVFSPFQIMFDGAFTKEATHSEANLSLTQC